MTTVNLYSDTQSRPTDGMREAIARAEVGDEQRKLDPTVNALQERVAELLGQEAALFLPTGSLCNAIATRLHVRPGGDEILMHRTAHPRIAEAGSPAVLSGATVEPLDGPGGMYSALTLRNALHVSGSRYLPRSRLVWVEQSTNIAGGRVWPLAVVEEVLAVAAEHDLRTHLDGARLLNAVAASGVGAARWTGGFDTAWLDFSKGLGAPFGACLAGSRELIDEAWRYKQMWGGALRQAGIIAAAALYALDHHVERLAEDHENARALAEGLAALPGARLDPAQVETNIVVFEVDDATAVVAALADEVELQQLGPRSIRAVTHLDVSRADVDRALTAFARVLG